MTGHGSQAGQFDAPTAYAASPGAAPSAAESKAETLHVRDAASVRAENVVKSFGTCRAVDGVSLDVRDGELLAILGPSGCGKSTLLRLIAGLERQDTGRIVLHGRDVGALPAAARGCGVVFQSYALFPNLTAARNVAFGIDRRRHDRRARAAKALALLEQVGLADAAGRYPAQLSGGQQQRVALARALATEPTVLLLDEPLSALDAKVRGMLRLEIRRLQQQTRLTTLLVTHDQEEAMTMADRVAVMNGGRIVQVDDPRGVYQRPADAFTAAFVGVMNLLNGWTVGPAASLRRDDVVLNATDAPQATPGSRVTVGFRPEEAILVGKAEWAARDNLFRCRVDRIEFRGPFVRNYVTLIGSGETVLVDAPVHDSARSDVQPGSEARLRVRHESVRVFRDPGAPMSR